MSQVNFSSARVAIQEFRRKVEQIQDHFAFQVLRPIYRKWLSAEILSGTIDARVDDERIFQHRWIAPKSEFLDPLKDANAAAVLLAAGLTSRREVCASLGIAVEDLDAQIASDRAREATLGLSFPPQPQPQPTPQQGEPDGTP